MAERVPGHGVDRSQMRELLALSPQERLELLRRDAEGLARLDRALQDEIPGERPTDG